MLQNRKGKISGEVITIASCYWQLFQSQLFPLLPCQAHSSHKAGDIKRKK